MRIGGFKYTAVGQSEQIIHTDDGRNKGEKRQTYASRLEDIWRAFLDGSGNDSDTDEMEYFLKRLATRLFLHHDLKNSCSAHGVKQPGNLSDCDFFFSIHLFICLFPSSMRPHWLPRRQHQICRSDKTLIHRLQLTRTFTSLGDTESSRKHWAG